MAKLTEDMVFTRAKTTDLLRIKKFNYWGAGLSDVSIVSRMENAQVLALTRNDITSLKDFASCKNLQELYLRQNNIQIDQVKYLQGLKHLRILWLSENPCAQLPNYRSTVSMVLPQLERLDDIPIETRDPEETCRQQQQDTTTYNTTYNPPYVNSSTNNSSQSVSSSRMCMRCDSQLSTSSLRYTDDDCIRPIPTVYLNPNSNTNIPVRTVIDNCNQLSSVLLLIKDLDNDSLRIIESAIQSRLQQSYTS